MENARKTRAVREHMQLVRGLDVIGFIYVEDGDGEKWPVLVGFGGEWSVWHDKRRREVRFTLVGQDSGGTVSREDMEAAMWRYFKMYPECCTPGMTCSLDAAVAHELARNTYGVAYHKNAWNGRKGE